MSLSAKIKPVGDTDFELRADNPSRRGTSQWHNVRYLATGILFGVFLVKSEVMSWFRIQEMFRFESFHMYGVMGSALVVGIISIQLIKKFKIKTLHGEPITFDSKPFHKGNI